MNNDLQKAVITALMIFSISVGYYFVWHLPRQEKREIAEQERKEEIANMQKCEQIASERSKQETKDFSDGNGSAFNPQYKFDKETNRCLYMSGYLTGEVFSQYIIDLYTNQQIVGYTKLNDKFVDGNEYEFKAKKKELFGE
jgi:hypothetical protein